jgi:hypothetical protein
MIWMVIALYLMNHGELELTFVDRILGDQWDESYAFDEL